MSTRERFIAQLRDKHETAELEYLYNSEIIRPILEEIEYEDPEAYDEHVKKYLSGPLNSIQDLRKVLDKLGVQYEKFVTDDGTYDLSPEAK